MTWKRGLLKNSTSSLDKLCLKIKDNGLGINLEKYLSGNQTADIIMQQANVGIFNGVVKHKNPTVVMFRNISYQVEMIKGILGLLNKAYQR